MRLTNNVLIPAILFCVACGSMLIIGNPMIAWLQNKRWKKDATHEETWAVREDTPDTHLAKTGTPSMGGIGIIAATMLSCVVLYLVAIQWQIIAGNAGYDWRNATEQIDTGLGFLLLFLGIFVALGLLGFADDWSKATGRGGLRARTKLIWQILLILGFVAMFVGASEIQRQDGMGSNFSELAFDNGVLFLLGCGVLMFVVIAICNAVNLTDGIDGLAAGLAVQCALILFLLDFRVNDVERLSIWPVIALGGACLGFLNFNKHKARVFMGDTGSLAIGAALGAGAILQHAVFLLPFIGFIYFVEMFSVMAQVLWFKYTRKKYGEGKRLFRRAPLHHHFELSGWSEWRVVIVFWAVNLFTSAVGLLLWYLEVLPRWP